MRTLAIISGKKHSPPKARIINFLEKDLKTEIHFTEKYSDIRDIIRKNRTAGTLICCGGDGTISEVINNMDLENQKLGVIPYGRGNGLARTLKVNSTSRALDTIIKGKIREVDLVACEYIQSGKNFLRYAVSTTGLGRIVLSTEKANKDPRKSYIFTSLCSAVMRDELEGEIQIGDQAPKPIKFHNFILNNTPYIGNFYAFPKANIQDSLMDFNISHTNSIEQILETLIVLCRLHVHIKKQHPETIHGQTHKLSLKLKDPAKIMIDGEVCDPVKDINFRVFPGKLRIFG